MKKFNLTILAYLIIVCSFLVSCGGEIKMDFYTSDLISSVEANDNTSIKVSLIIEGMSEEYDYAFLQNFIPSFSNPHYVEYNFGTSLSFDITVPLIKQSDLAKYNHEGNLFEIVGQKTQEGYAYYFNINTELIAQINEYTSKTMYQGFDLADFTYKYKIVNDGKATMRFSIFSSYVDGNPVPSHKTFEVERRGALDIKMSEVFTKSLSQDEKYYFLTILK